jgi:hypothetical protein
LFRLPDSPLCLEKFFESPPVIPEDCSQVGHECTLEKIINESKESRNRNLMQLLEQFLELVSVFKEASKNFIIIFLLKCAG